MITSVIGILLCITCLCSATWAWFATDISSGNNTLCSGNFGLIVTVKDENGAHVPVTVGTFDGISSCTLSGSGDQDTAMTYTVTLKMTDDTTVKKGFCTVRSGDSYYQTDSINVDTGTHPFTFTLTLVGNDAALTFTPVWGYPASPEIDYNGTLSLTK